MHFVHFYPFPLEGPYGGAMRLAAAVEASRRAGPTTILAYNKRDRQWEEFGDLGQPRVHSEMPRNHAFRRLVFPSTLYEAGLKPSRDLRRAQIEALPRPHIAILHTSYLTPLISKVSRFASKTLLDVYDLVWRAHSIDADTASRPLRAVRSAYSSFVKSRESAALRSVDLSLIAGWTDYELAKIESNRVTWVPTPIRGNLLQKRVGDGVLSVGILGNFEHYPTAAMADGLLASPLGSDPLVKVIFAGLHSERRFAATPNLVALGQIEHVEEFYGAVDCVVAFAQAGSGAKIKIAEAVMAGRLVITSALGADGFPPHLRRHLLVVPSLETLTRSDCMDWVNRWPTDVAAEAFERDVSWSVGTDRYAKIFDSI